MTPIDTLITIHDQDLVDACDAEGRFANVAPFRYLFVGPRAIDRLVDRTWWGGDVVVSRAWHPNFEDRPDFLDFTGWWSLAHHQLVHAPAMLCLQYDHQVPEPILPAVWAALSVHPMVAFVAGHRSAHNFMLLIPGFEDAYRAGLEAVGSAPMESWPDFDEWPSTQGTAWRTEVFYEFMEWVTPCFDVWNGNPWAGHLIERMPKAFLVATGRTPGYAHGLIVHEGRDCHGTCHLMAGDASTYAERQATFGKVVGEPIAESSR